MRASRQPWGWDGADLVPQKDTGQWSERSRDVLSMNGTLTLGGGNLPDGGTQWYHSQWSARPGLGQGQARC